MKELQWQPSVELLYCQVLSKELLDESKLCRVLQQEIRARAEK
jgi:hypothetical protein